MVAMDLLIESFNLKGSLLDLLKQVTITADKEESLIMQGIQERNEILLVQEHLPIEKAYPVMLPIIEWLSSLLEDTHRGGHALVLFHQNMVSDSLLNCYCFKQ
jgi:hypothetical protein